MRAGRDALLAAAAAAAAVAGDDELRLLPCSSLTGWQATDIRRHGSGD